MKRDVIPICTIHDRFQTSNGRWLNKPEDFNSHVVHTGSQEASLIESPCDKCDIPSQLKLNL